MYARSSQPIRSRGVRPRRGSGPASALALAAGPLVLIASLLLVGSAAGGTPGAGAPTPPAGSPTPADTPVPTLPPSATPTPTAAPTPTPTPLPVPTGRPLPDCRYADVATGHAGLDDWRITLLDTTYRLPREYRPDDLVDTSVAGMNGGFSVRRVIVTDLTELVAAARRGGVPVSVVSGYRSWERQKETFDRWVRIGGYDEALRTSARPGHSEHQLGTTVDLTSVGGRPPWQYRDWGATATGAWVAQNAWRFGFVMSYPRGASDTSCYAYEPWHYRHVGREIAALINERGVAPRVLLWELQ